jgi:DNA replication and repair protein RecF
MSLQNISLTNFRNYGDAKIDTDAELVLILGANASGKTNLLESIYYLSRLKSFRAPDNLLVKSQEDYFKIAAQFDEKNLEAAVQIYPRALRQYKIDDLKVKKLNWKTFNTVLFVPQDLNLFELGPSLRRKFLNQVLSQTSLEYALDLATLEHVLKQRAALFSLIWSNNSDRSELEIWNQELARVGTSIRQHRKTFASFLNDQFQQVYSDLSDFSGKLTLIYKNTETETPEEFLLKLKKCEEAEIRSGQNLFGPHRDDFIIKKDGKENIYNSSRGEQRSQILTLKLLQAKFLDQTRRQTIILLDDVFSELDETRRSRLIETLSGHQIFITTTEEQHLPKFQANTKILHVVGNQIS